MLDNGKRLNWNIQAAYLKARDYLAAINELPQVSGDFELQQQRLPLVKSCFDSTDSCFRGQMLPGKFRSLMFDPFAQDLTWLLSHVDDLERMSVELLVEQSLFVCQSFLWGPPGILCIMPGGHPNFPEIHPNFRRTGIGGDANSTIIRLYISPIEGWKRWLPSVLAHEYNHYVRFQKCSCPENLLDHLVAEGLAEAFSRVVSPDVATPYTQEDFISPDEILQVWKIMQPDLRATEDKVRDRHLSGKDKSYSFLSTAQKATIEYTIGHLIIQSCMEERYKKRNIEVDWLELTQSTSETILNDSKFATD